MRAITFLLILSLGLIQLGCKHCLNKKGSEQSVTHELEPFNSLDISGKFNITLVQGSSSKITLSGYQGILETVRYKVSNKDLVVSNNNKCSNLNGYDDWVNLTIELDSFSYGRIAVPGRLDSEGVLKWQQCSLLIDNCDLNTNLKLNMLDFELRMDGGTSTIELTGASGRTKLYNNGNGHIYAKNLVNTNLSVFSIGTGVIESTVTNRFVASIQGSTEVYYYGNPTEEEITIKGNEGAAVTAR